MRFGRIGGLFVTGLMLSGCAVVGPIVGPLLDSGMNDAPHAACAAINGEHPRIMRPRPGAAPESVEAGAPAQCFVLAEELADGSRRAWSGGALRPGRTLLAIHQPDADSECAGTFTHLTVSGAAQGAGRAELSAWDMHARPGHSRAISWSRSFARRDFALASIGSTLMNPAGTRIRVIEGNFDPANLCFKSH